MGDRNGIGQHAWLGVSAERRADFSPAAIVVLGGRHCLDRAAELAAHFRPGTTIRLVHENGQIIGANREGWVFLCT